MLCKYIRTDSLNLIEAWMFSDQRLASTLGRSDGKVEYIDIVQHVQCISPYYTTSFNVHFTLKFMILELNLFGRY